MSTKYLGMILLSSVLTFAPAAFSQTNPDKAAKSNTMQKSAATQDNIKKAQQALKDKNLYNGPVDGMMSADFESALRNFQTQNKLPASGKLDRQTMVKMGVTTAPAKEEKAPAKTKKKSGMQGSMQSGGEIRQVQTALQSNGIDPGPIDGIMGPKTHKAIAAFQRQEDLFASGQLDDKTLAALAVNNKTMPTEEPAREKPSVPPDNSYLDNPPDRFPEPETLGLAQQPNIGLGTASVVEDIRQLQMALKNRGYDPGEINGMVTSQTQDAIRRFQAANNLPVTGMLDNRTQAALGVNVRGTTDPDTKPPAPDESLNSSSTQIEREGVFTDIERAKPSEAAPVMEHTALQTTAQTAKVQDTYKADKHAKSDKHKEDKTDHELDKRIAKATEVLNSITGVEDKRIPDEMLQRAEGIVVIPDMIKGAFGIGGRYGKGVVAKRISNGRWSAPAFVSIGGGSVGAQLGISSTDLVLVFTDKDAFEALQKKMTLKLGADAAVAAGPIGRSGEAGVTHDLKSGIYAYSRSKGLFAGIALDGAVIDMDQDDNHKMYGSNVDAAAILNNPTMVSRSSAARTFVDTLDRVAVKKMSEQ